MLSLLQFLQQQFIMYVFGCSNRLPSDEPVIQLVPISKDQLSSLTGLTDAQHHWLQQQHFSAEIGAVCPLPEADGSMKKVLFGWDVTADPWDFALVFKKLPFGYYRLIKSDCVVLPLPLLAKIWGLCCYTFTRYKVSKRQHPVLLVDTLAPKAFFQLNLTLNAIYHIRNWINTPAEDFGPEDCRDLCQAAAQRYGASFDEIVGDDLLAQNFPLVHAVGRASTRLPRVLRLNWGNSKHPSIALIGKGVCFDTGGIQVKPHEAMQTMKKDMGGAAHMLALCEMIMAAKLPVQVTLWIAAVDNSVDARSFLPGDVYRARNGTSVEIGHTDAEGRLLLADLLSAASDEKHDLIIDYATLTGAQRIALGMDLPAFFSNNAAHTESLIDASEYAHDPLWPLPLFKPYRKHLDSTVADLSSTGKTPHGGAITAALFLEHFVSPHTPWIHFDASCYHPTSRPGREKGGDAMGLEAMFHWIQKTFCPPA